MRTRESRILVVIVRVDRILVQLEFVIPGVFRIVPARHRSEPPLPSNNGHAIPDQSPARPVKKEDLETQSRQASVSLHLIEWGERFGKPAGQALPLALTRLMGRTYRRTSSIRESWTVRQVENEVLWAMRLGLFGGTFDPIHLGHLILAEQCRESCRLDRVWFVVAGVPPHKPVGRTAVAHRLEMVRIAIAGHPAFQRLRNRSDATRSTLQRRNPRIRASRST